MYKRIGRDEGSGTGCRRIEKVLSNVKTRGTFGEVQLGALLDQMLSPEQYEANVKTKKMQRNLWSSPLNFRERK